MSSATYYRTHHCGELRLSDAGVRVTLAGWVHRSRDLGGMTFIDLRDRHGIIQLAFNMETQALLCEKARKAGREDVIRVSGTVTERSSKNAHLATGEIEIVVTDLEFLNHSETPPFTMEDQTDGGEELRMKYRYLDLRRPFMQQKFILRAALIKAVREYLDENGFLEIETPNLIKSTPEGARDFIVPSRMQPGNFYALPQSPQILKQLLMVAGMDRYYQIVKCFRDEDFRGDRQPEFSQIDCEMSFVRQEDIWQMFEGMVKHVFRKLQQTELPDFLRLPYRDAIARFGTDKPDMRFGCEIKELNEVCTGSEFAVFNQVLTNNGLIAGLVATGCAGYSRKQIDSLTDYVKAPHRGAGGLIYIRYEADGSVKSSVDKFFSPEHLQKILEQAGAVAGDLLLIVADKTSKTRKVLGDLRLELARMNDWIDPAAWSIFWVVDMPMFEPDEETGEPIFAHHPFCSPHPDDVEFFDTDPFRVRAQSYDLVMNGNEILSGSIRIHQPALQRKIFQILGFSEQEIESRFGFMVNAFRYGAPPHGGCAFGLDRWVMLMAGGETIRDVIAFPKNNAGKDLMMEAPSPVDDAQLKMLHLDIIPTENKGSA
ncbi:MAG: aspartate--tRNA ligase [Chitinophagales bacterium]|nr:aspartate--tRNA ligase [Chitinophagales bacterium]MCB9021255.1 aspartate--tRNA ligase [Chitinophagales bacterium]HAE35880.1 aspartate--tRNA ligase [Bacteroidota bacterium]HPR27873.1 aspartate--tRNA ligase [Chitinophagales bacterium]HRX23149.1 aspartate--tRNA ligase [Chitinophagales bacterium]